jgi:predicted dehydrogenase
MADLHTFIPRRRQPSGPVETFSTDLDADVVEREIGTEDIATVLVRFENGARGTVAISQLSPGRKNSLAYEIDGAQAAVAWDSEQPDQLWIGHREAANEILQRNPALMGAAGQSATFLPAGHVEGFADTFRALFRAVYAEVGSDGATGRAAYPTFADGHDEMLVGDAIAASARNAAWTQVARPA